MSPADWSQAKSSPRSGTDEEPPEPQDLSRSTREAFVAAAVQGLIVGLVRAAFARAEAHGYRALTNESPE